MSSTIEHLRLTEKLFQDVILHLQQRIQRLEADTDEDEVNAELAYEERVPAEQSTITALRLEICLYSLCLDRVRQQMETVEGTHDEERAHARENFFRLMSTVAQSELARDARRRSFGLASERMVDRPLTNSQMFTALEGTAERQLASLISM